MSKYNHFAKQLDQAFKAARSEYTAAYEAMQAAEKACSDASQWRQEKYIGENAARKARADAAFMEAKANFEEKAATVWTVFNNQREALRAELEGSMKTDGLATPDQIDANGLELLKSGILNPDEFVSLATRYDNNPTMLRLVAQYAKNALKDDLSAADRGKLYRVFAAAKDGQSSVLQAWDTLSSVADTCSGQRRSRRESPDYIVSIAAKWEDLSGEAVTNF